MSDDILSNVTNEGSVDQSTQSGTPPAPEANDPVSQLVGEGKKYSDINALAESRLKADEHIARIEEENRVMREEREKLLADAAQARTLSDVVAEIRNAASQETGENQPQVSEADVLNLVEATLSKRESAQQQKANRTKINEALRAQFSDNDEAATSHLRKRKAELGLDDATFAALSNGSPEAFLKLMEVESNIQTTVPNVYGQGTVDPQKRESLGTVRNYEYYKKLRKEMGNPAFYADLELIQQMYRDQEQLGDKFGIERR